jgi:hypothetical protein
MADILLPISIAFGATVIVVVFLLTRGFLRQRSPPIDPEALIPAATAPVPSSREQNDGQIPVQRPPTEAAPHDASKPQ